VKAVNVMAIIVINVFIFGFLSCCLAFGEFWSLTTYFRSVGSLPAQQMASLEKRSLSDLIEVMADERWERLIEQQGIAYVWQSEQTRAANGQQQSVKASRESEQSR
jgi:hypothetical protein